MPFVTVTDDDGVVYAKLRVTSFVEYQRQHSDATNTARGFGQLYMRTEIAEAIDRIEAGLSSAYDPEAATV